MTIGNKEQIPSSENIFFYEGYCIYDEIVYNKSKEIVYCTNQERFQEIILSMTKAERHVFSLSFNHK